MQGEIIRQESWRSQVHELFSDPMGSPEVWNEISSCNNQPLNTKDWYNLAFDAAHFGQLSLLQWLLCTKKVPILVQNKKGCNLLHAAASFGHESIVECLLEYKMDVLQLFVSKSKRSRTALEIAVCSNRFSTVECLLDIELLSLSSASQAFGVIRHCCEIAESAMAKYLANRLRTMEIRAFLFDLAFRREEDMESLISQVASFPWWENLSNIEWNELEKFELYRALHSAARSQNVFLIEWFLNKWKVPLEPPSLYTWKGLSIADVVVMEQIDNEGFLENLNGDADEGDWWNHSSKRYFDMLVAARWEDGRCSSLIPTLEPLIYRSERHSYLKNKWFEALCERNYERRLPLLEVLSQKHEDSGAQSFALPRLDLVVACGQLHILQWLINRGFVNLDLPLSTNAEAMDMDVEDNAIISADDNICAICFSVKRFPQQLQCGHSYCSSCIRQVYSYARDNMQSFQCPYCRRHLSVPPSTTISAALQHYLMSKSPWLDYQSCNTIGQILMGLAAGTGSVLILEYLIVEHHIDPLTTVFAHGRNVMHLAASRGNVIACKWLCLNGYLELAHHLSDQQLSPVREAINCTSHGASLIFDLFEQFKVLPENWIELAGASPNADIIQNVEHLLSQKYNDLIFKLLASNAPLEQLNHVIDNSSFGKCEIFDKKSVRSILGTIIEYGRVDVLIWMYNSCFRRRTFYFSTHRKFIRRKISECSNHSAMITFIAEVDTGEKLNLEISKCFKDFTELILKGAPIMEIEEVMNRQSELINQIENLSLKADPYKISFDCIIRHGLNVLESAAYHGHLHLVDWILNMPNLDVAQSIKQVFSIAIQEANVALLRFVLSWVDKHNLRIPTSIENLACEHKSLLHAVVSRFALSCSSLGSKDEAKVCPACIEMAKLLVSRGDIDVNALNDKDQTALYHIARIYHYKRKGKGFQDASELIKSDWVLEMIQILVKAGTNLQNIDAQNTTFFELVLSSSSALLLKSIRWLALDRGVDVQFVRFCCDEWDIELRQRAENEFKAIREEQQALQSL